MGSETCNPTSSPGGKRSRDPEDEVYIDNLHSHKRYLSEIMASSLNGLTVGDPLPENLMESPARSDSIFYPRDDMCLQYSPMSEDSDESRSYETSSVPTSPVSPYRSSRPLSSFSSTPPATSSTGCVLAGTTSSQSRQRGSDSEGRFPSSPSDICHSADLRRAALLRSVQMRTQPAGPSAFELPGHLGQGSATANVEAEEPLPCNLGEGSVAEIVEAEEPHCHYMKSLVVDGECPMEDCSGMGVSADEFNHGKS